MTSPFATRSPTSNNWNARLRRAGAVSLPPDIPPSLSGMTAVGDMIELTASESSTCYWLLDSNATRTPAQVEAGGGAASGSFAVTSGSNDEPIDISLVPAGNYYLHAVLKDAVGLYSSVSTLAIEVEPAPPTLSVVQAVSSSDQSFNTTNHVVLPSGITAGNTLLLILSIALDRTITAPAGWDLVATYAHQTDKGHTHIYRRTATGAESGTTLTFTTNMAVKSAYSVLELDLAEGLIETAGVQTLDPPSLTPSGGTREYLWITHVSNSSANVWTVNGPPATYGNMKTAVTIPTYANSDGERTIATAYKNAVLLSDDPAPFNISPNPTSLHRFALTIAAW